MIPEFDYTTEIDPTLHDLAMSWPDNLSNKEATAPANAPFFLLVSSSLSLVIAAITNIDLIVMRILYDDLGGLLWQPS